MIERFVVHNYRCLRAVEGRLTPLHAFIGPNDSGKSTLLRAIGTAAHLCGDQFREHDRDSGGTRVFAPFHPALSENGDKLLLGIERGHLDYRFEHVPAALPDVGTESGPKHHGQRNITAPISKQLATMFSSLSGCAALCRFDPDRLREPSALIPAGAEHTFLHDRGHGLPAMLQGALGRGDATFAEIQSRALQHFPRLKGIRVEARTERELALVAVMKDGRKIDATSMSEGFLYFLAFAVLRHAENIKLFLVEEPENGLHPSRVRDVVAVLRELSKTAQVLIATHSPLVINELQPEEITLVTRPDLRRGTVLTPITETKNFAERSKVYALGELWLSYADGDFESELVP